MAYKISIWIVLFLLFFNGGAVMLNASGAADYLGVNPQTGNEEALNNATAASEEEVSTGSGGGSTLFGLYNQLSNPLETFFNAVMPGAAMLKNIGVPVYLVNFLFGGLALVPTIDTIMFMRSG